MFYMMYACVDLFEFDIGQVDNIYLLKISNMSLITNIYYEILPIDISLTSDI